MSQHHWETSVAGKRLAVLMGWDRPLQGFFCVVRELTEKNASPEDVDGEEDLYLYCNLDDPALTRTMGMSPSLDYFAEKLLSFGIQVPAEMMEGIWIDQVLNEGNRCAVYDENGRKE